MKEKDTINIYNDYIKNFPEDKRNLSVLEKQIQDLDTDLFDRKNFIGHIVANALIISADKVLVIFHNKLKMYIQPGGHVDPEDDSVLEAAFREVREETGIDDLTIREWTTEKNIPIFIESHLIPANKEKKELEHWHHDFLYIFDTNKIDVNLQLEEVTDFKWIDISEVLKKDSDSFIGKALTRLSNYKNNLL